MAVKSTRWYKLRFNYKGKTYTGYSNAKYVKLAKKPVTKKVAVVAMSDAQFEQAMKMKDFRNRINRVYVHSFGISVLAV